MDTDPPPQPQPQRNWQTRLVLSTSSLGVALSDESHRSLKSCLLWLRWANSHLARVILSLKSLLDQYEQSLNRSRTEGADNEEERNGILGRIDTAKDEIVKTLRKCVEVVSLYAGAALPEQARASVRRHLFGLPRKFQLALSSPSGTSTPTGAAAAPKTGESKEKENRLSSANRVLILAKEGLDMMKQVSDVVEETIQKAEGWCEFLGRKGVGEVKMEEGRMPGDGQVRGEVEWREEETEPVLQGRGQ